MRATLVSLCLLPVVDEDTGEQDHTHHHREGGSVVGEGGGDEPLVLCVPEGPDGYLCAAVEVAVAESHVVNLELEHAVHIR